MRSACPGCGAGRRDKRSARKSRHRPFGGTGKLSPYGGELLRLRLQATFGAGIAELPARTRQMLLLAALEGTGSLIVLERAGAKLADRIHHYRVTTPHPAARQARRHKTCEGKDPRGTTGRGPAREARRAGAAPAEASPELHYSGGRRLPRLNTLSQAKGWGRVARACDDRCRSTARGMVGSLQLASHHRADTREGPAAVSPVQASCQSASVGRYTLRSTAPSVTTGATSRSSPSRNWSAMS
jgi:hypothetical protein